MSSAAGPGDRPGPASVGAATRGRVVLLATTGAVLCLAAGLLPWIEITVTDAAGTSTETFTGASSAPGMTSAALAALAGAFALTLADGWARRLCGAVITVCGVALVFLPVDALLDPGAVSLERTAAVSIGAAPWVAAIGGLLVVAGGVLALLRGEAWPARPARRTGERARSRERSDWDRLSDGDDPT